METAFFHRFLFSIHFYFQRSLRLAAGKRKDRSCFPCASSVADVKRWCVWQEWKNGKATVSRWKSTGPGHDTKHDEQRTLERANGSEWLRLGYPAWHRSTYVNAPQLYYCSNLFTISTTHYSMSNNLCSTTHENPITLKTVFDVISFFSSSEIGTLIQRLLITLIFEHRERDIRNLKRKKNCLRDFLNIYIYI